MPAEEREMSIDIQLLKEIVAGQQGFRTDFKAMSDMVVRTDQRTLTLEEDQAATEKTLHGNGREGLVADFGEIRSEMKLLRNSLDMHLKTQVVIEGRTVDWDKIGKIVIGFMAAAGYWLGIN